MAPATLFESQLCEGNNLTISLYNPDSFNPDAISAQLTLFTDIATYRRDVTAASGYLSGDTTQTHFGIPAGATITALEVVWPDGNVTRVAEADIPLNTHLKLTYND
jgi:hypothetical protein